MENQHPPVPVSDSQETTLVLSDSELLVQVIAANLDRPVQGVCLAEGSSIPPASNYDLIVVALSASSGEPVAALAQAEVIEHVGKVPVLIISNRRFDSLPTERIYYLPFPFDAAALRRQVQAILGGTVDTHLTGAAKKL